MTTQAPTTGLHKLAPSAKLVVKILEHEGESTQSDLVESTLLPQRTVRYALTQLEEKGIVDARISFRDARQRIYSLEYQGRERTRTES